MSELARRASRERLDAAIVRLRYALAAENLRIKARRFLALCKAYDPNQPRVPAGSSEGGQWTSEGRPVRLASSDRKPFGRAGRIGILLDAGRRLIDAFRKENQLRDFFGDDVGTVAITSLNDKYIFGFNSGTSEFSSQYTDRDEADAVELRGRMLEKYPRVMSTRNIGSMPNNALYHAETNVLLSSLLKNPSP